VPEEVEDDLARLERARAIIEQAHSTPGAAVRRDIDRVFRSFYVFVRNAAELRDLIASQQRLDKAMLTPHDEIDRALDEIDRLLHNFLAACFTLYSHEQKLRKRYLTAEELAEYDRRSPAKHDVYKLVQELRNSAQHSRLPLVRQQLSARLDKGKLTGGSATFKIEPAYIETLTNLPTKASAASSSKPSATTVSRCCRSSSRRRM
jgi:tRNA nucleotidyltransferase/poly(A) polymerase